ncbi:NAD+ synthase [Breznakiella homolactica]|uniref:Glutamine-dependent NAD(+) synthetase n=1 Tax=Breznakiella homolactica TaxID=2798577 RepID=A0A7T8BBA0_9SPIR|nr:NAD+ synthase [Breznakiella homolactica]QQO10337.1 NAD+ synthase [Breznakiella homolactica]
MRIAIAQIDSTIGDFSGNMEKIVSYSKKAQSGGQADLVLFPELSVCGYPPMDLLDQEIFTDLNARTVHLLQRELPRNIAVGIGYVGRNPESSGKSLVNVYGIILNGSLVFEQIKTLLPSYDVFDEARYFESARQRSVFEWKGERIGFAICEDVWRETGIPGTTYASDPVGDLLDQGITLLCVPSASPFYAGKLRVRMDLAERISLKGNVPLVYVNAVGANDSIIFDGRSFAVAPLQSPPREGSAVPLRISAKAFEEDLVVWDSGSSAVIPAPPQSDAAAADAGFAPEELDTLEAALVMGIRGYMAKCGFTDVHLGLSGGIDSALVAYLAVKAAGPEHVACFGMPSQFSSQGSKDDAAELAENLGCRFEMIPIEGIYGSFTESLGGVFQGRPFDVTEENLQARIRGTLLMAYSNKFGSMLLTTGNKSELAMGYCTLYGDMNGALGVIGDLFKTEVFALCRRINRRSVLETGKPIIPEATLTKPPSAELRPDQKDQDSLPPYEVLDAILKLYLFENLSGAEIAARGFDPELAARIIRAVARAEFKRRQAPPVLKISPRAFGMGRRMPIARHIYEK